MGWRVRRRLRPGELGVIVRLHGAVYAAEYGYDGTFEAYVAEDLAAFVRSFDPRVDGVWVAEEREQVVGFIAVAHQPGDVARLRWFLVIPSMRGRGLGRQLLESAVGFCRECGYRSVYLWTTSELAAAHHLYTGLGFVTVEEETHERWGKRVTEERMELPLGDLRAL